MKQTLTLLMLMALSTLTAMAQQDSTATTQAQEQTAAQGRMITGTLADKETREAVMQTTVQLFRADDSTYVAGTVSDEDGHFALRAPQDGRYVIKMTNIGYKQVVRNLTISDSQDFAFGRINMETDAVLLKEVVANGVAAKVIVKEDTFVYNAAAYRTPEGSMLEELVKRLPGAQIDESGKITINGKEVKKVMVDGKEFMNGDTQTALKNLPTSIVEKVKAYDEKSDLAKMTGIDDGEETTVLDFGIKRGMNKGTMFNTDLAAGTEDRYSGNVMGAYMQDNNRLMAFANANNVGNRGFSSGGRGGGGGGNGLQSSKMAALNYNYDKKDKLRIDFSVRWNHSDGDNQTITSSENFISTPSTFSNGINSSRSRSDSWNFGGRMEWKPDTLTTISVRPSFSTSKNDSHSGSANARFNGDPYLMALDYANAIEIDPLDSIFMSELDSRLLSDARTPIRVNRNDNKSLSYSTNNNFNVQATVSRKLSSKGRNITVQGRYAYTDGENLSLSSQLTRLYERYDADFTLLQKDSSYYRNRYNTTPNNRWNYNLTATYSEPIALATFLQFRYQYQFSHTKNDRSTYDFVKYADPTLGLSPQLWQTLPQAYRNWDSYLNPYMDNYGLETYKDQEQSRYSEYNNDIHEMELTLRRTTNNYNLNVGVMLQPQRSELTYRYRGIDTVVVRNVSNFTPTFNFRYRWTKQKSIRLNYRGSTSQPSMTDMLPITDDTNPLNISKGNPDLKPSFTNTFQLQYNNYVQKHMRTVMSYINFQTTKNNVANMVTYDPISGGSTRQPMNINGNWNVHSAFMFNTAVDTLGRWNVNTMTELTYNNRVSYLILSQKDPVTGRDMRDPVTRKVMYNDPTKNFVRTTRIDERLGMSYRNEWLEVELNGNVRYEITKNKLQPNNNHDTWDFGYGTDITANMPWGMSISTGAHMNSRRGYGQEDMNTDEFVWNAQISQSFLTGKPLTVSLQFYDILNQKSSFSRNISATSRSDVYYNSINNYAMLHVIYRFHAFGGKAARQQQRRGNEPEGGMSPGGMPPAGGPRGGFMGGGGGFMGGGGRF